MTRKTKWKEGGLKEGKKNGIVLFVPRGWNVTPPGSFSLALSESCGSYGETYNRLTSLANNALKAQSSLSLSLSVSLQKVNGFQKNKKYTHTHTHK